MKNKYLHIDIACRYQNTEARIMFADQELDKVIESDKTNVWHHLSQYKAIKEKKEPLMMVKGEGSYV